MGTKSNIAPRPALLAVGALLLATVGAAFLGHTTHAGPVLPDATPVAYRDLRFLDRSDGAVVVEAADGKLVHVFQGEQGFLRGTMRGFVRTRRLDQMGPQQPFRLTRWSDGRLTLDDPATSQHVELMAFGPSNSGVFAPLLDENP